MGDVLACRLCLATNVKLCNMYRYRLVTAYENLTGFEMKRTDRLQHACVLCSTLLIKSASFQQMCRDSQDLVRFSERHRHSVSTDYIESLKIESRYGNMQIKSNINILEMNHDEELKEEVNWVNSDDEYQSVKEESESSDEETLASKAVRKNKEMELNSDVQTEKFSVELQIDKIEGDEKVDCDDNDIETKKVKGEDGEEVDIKSEEEDYENETEKDNDFKEGEVDIFVLTKEEQIEEIQSRKNTLNYLNSFYKCNYCFKGFITDVTYKNHMVRHDPSSGAHVCEVCLARWPNERSLRSHRVTAHERKFICRLCNYICKSRHRAKEHSKWHSGHTFVCKFCGATFNKSTSQLTHIRMHHPSKHTCGVCGESFIGENGLNMHKKKAHRELMNGEYGAELCCANCNTQFQCEDAFKRHMIDDQLCDPNMKICYGPRAGLIRHCRACVQCGQTFSTEEEFKHHIKDHSKEEPVKCDECSRTFAHSRSFTSHYQRAHANANARAADARALDALRVVCELCGMKCISNATLRYHQRLHTGERPFQCKHCPKTFTVFQRLQVHSRTHTGERPYQCTHCPKAFKHKAALNRHDRVHTGAKPYVCSHCGKSFSQSNSMKLHIRTVHLKMPSPYRRRVPAE